MTAARGGLSREADIAAFLDAAGWAGAVEIERIGDASTRTYRRLEKNGVRRLLMDAPPAAEAPRAPPDADEATRRALGWNAMNRLAACRVDAFVCIGAHLRSLGLSAPEVYWFDAAAGLALVEDFGDALFARILPHGADEAALYAETAAALAHVQAAPLPVSLSHGGAHWDLSLYDGLALEAAADLFFDWQPKYAPDAVRLTAEDRAEWAALRDALIAEAKRFPRAFTVRDVMSENLIWLPDRKGLARVGFLDFQDAIVGWPAWDFAMLLFDARRDVSDAAAEAAILRFLQDSGRDADAFARELAVLGALNTLRILGVFARLIHRDGKPRYAQFMDREWGHLRATLAHPALAGMRAFLEPRCAPLRG